MSTPPSRPWIALLDALRQTPNRLRDLVAGAGDTCFVQGTTCWSICEIIGHMCAVESPYRARLVRITLEENPRVAAIGRITGDYDPATPASILVDTFAALRRDTLAFLESLSPMARARPALHAELGPTTLRSQVEALLAHDEEHLAQIAAKVGGAAAGPAE